jgi:glycosyltransferase involved in cell wall biosynthesis
VLVTSATDKTALLDIVPQGADAAPITVLSNGVDQDYFRVNPEVKRDPDTLVFSGKMSYHANVSMVMYLLTEIMPRLWAKRPSVRLVVVGKDPPASIRKLADSSRVVVTGTVDDIRPYLWKATGAVVPLVYGAGVQNKILEAMSTGTPVITNSKVLASLSVTPRKELLVADSADEFAHSALQLIEDAALQKSVGGAGLAYVQRHHSWKESARKMVEIYESMPTPARQ